MGETLSLYVPGGTFHDNSSSIGLEAFWNLGLGYDADETVKNQQLFFRNPGGARDFFFSPSWKFNMPHFRGIRKKSRANGACACDFKRH